MLGGDRGRGRRGRGGGVEGCLVAWRSFPGALRA